MPRPAKLSKREMKGKSYYFTQAGGKTKYFGQVGVVSLKDARQAFREYMGQIEDRPKAPKITGPTVQELVDKYLEWLADNGSAAHHKSRTSYLKNFTQWRSIGAVRAASVTDEQLVAFRSAFKLSKRPKTGKRPSERTVVHHVKAVKCAWSWAASADGGYLLPKGTNPFVEIGASFKTKKMTEADLITEEEIDLLYESAEEDSAESHRIGRWVGLTDLLKCYRATGARTGELISARVRDFSSRDKTITLKEHKRAKSTGQLRVIFLKGESVSIVKRFIEGKKPSDFIFDHGGKAWNRDILTARFAKVRDGAGVRKSISIYSFRHLFISEGLRAGISAPKLAEIVGTSLTEIERCYGHFWQADLRRELEKLP